MGFLYSFLRSFISSLIQILTKISGHQRRPRLGFKILPSCVGYTQTRNAAYHELYIYGILRQPGVSSLCWRSTTHLQEDPEMKRKIKKKKSADVDGRDWETRDTAADGLIGRNIKQYWHTCVFFYIEKRSGQKGVHTRIRVCVTQLGPW